MATIYASKGLTIKTIATVSTWNAAVEIVEREVKYGCADQVWIEMNGKIYTTN